MQQNSTLAFAFGFGHHNRQIAAAIRNFMLLHNTLIEKVAVIFIKQVAGFLVSLLFLWIGIINEEL